MEDENVGRELYDTIARVESLSENSSEQSFENDNEE
jgi:hypothetical protein